MTLLEKIQANLLQIHQQGLHRQRRVIADNTVLQFSSNDYLSLCCDKRVAAAYQTGFKRYPVGSGGSAAVCGYHDAHYNLEQSFAQLLNVDACLLFTSGYAANLAVTRLLASLSAHCLIDKGIHASMYDGLHLSAIKYDRYLHNDLSSFKKKILTIPENSVILTESIFSMSGQRAPLVEIHAIAEKHSAALIVDEAHAFGVIGKQGKGAVSAQNLSQHQVPLRIIPLGKACAGQGAIVAGLGPWIESLLQSARAFIYSTAMSPALAYGLQKTLEIIIAADERRNKLHDLINYFRQTIKQSSLNWTDSTTAIQQLRLGNAHLALGLSQKLQSQGIACLPMRYPTVSHADTGLRVILNYQHQPEDIDQLFKVLHDVS